MDNVLNEIIFASLSLVLMGLGTVLTRLTNNWANKTKSEYLSNVILRIDDLAMLVVTDLAQSWKAPRERDGKWNDANKEEAKKKAVTALKEYLGPKGVKEVLKLVGGDSIKLDNLLGTAVESQVKRLKTAAPAKK